MTSEQINNLLQNGVFPEATGERQLVETHISWIILCDQFVYKIKKPVHYSFVDYSTIELRQHFCQKEIELNRRFSDNVYIDVQTIFKSQDSYEISGIRKEAVADYAVKMHRLDTNKQMDVLLSNHCVTANQIKLLAQKIAAFHLGTQVIHKKNTLDIRSDFNDLESERDFIMTHLGIKAGNSVKRAIQVSDAFINRHYFRLMERLNAGFYRDCHGDLHCGNIFLLPALVPFDCIEFNDELRQIDVLNEVAFICMDLEALNSKLYADLFLQTYNQLFPMLSNEIDHKLFNYYKSYRANIRAKVNCIRARNAKSDSDKAAALASVVTYLALMEAYLE